MDYSHCFLSLENVYKLVVTTLLRFQVKGLCGNYNGDMRDDFQTPSGGLAESSALIFADSWKLKATCPKAQAVTVSCYSYKSLNIEFLLKNILLVCSNRVKFKKNLSYVFFLEAGSE